MEVIVTSESGLAQQITAGIHHLRADEPVPLGSDARPSPYELLLASLGEIEMVGSLDSEQKNRLREIAEKCPVHRTLQSEINIRTSVV